MSVHLAAAAVGFLGIIIIHVYFSTKFVRCVDSK